MCRYKWQKQLQVCVKSVSVKQVYQTYFQRLAAVGIFTLLTLCQKQIPVLVVFAFDTESVVVAASQCKFTLLSLAKASVIACNTVARCWRGSLCFVW
jgi:hypothetical protein